MNLIEEYGSYESARDGLRVLESSPYAVDQAYAHELKNNMLEYRRQHNIYEVGDKVVIKAHPFWPEDYVTQTVEQENIGKWYMSAWRHATDAEIKAGERRPELDSDTCSDIRNHVSPLTKVIDR